MSELIHISKIEQRIFFDGQVFDAYAFVCDLLRAASRRIILIDNYVDESVLLLLAKRKAGVGVQLLTKNISRQVDQHRAEDIVELEDSTCTFT